MSAYLIVDVEVKDADAYAEYIKLAPAFIEKHGGRYLARGGQPQALEGSWQPQRLVLAEFPDAASARAFLADPGYAPVKAIRHRAAATNITLVEGLSETKDAAAASQARLAARPSGLSASGDAEQGAGQPPATAGLRHVALLAHRFEETERFYTELMGMAVEWRPDADNCYLTSGNDNLALHRAEADEAAGDGAQRLDHIGFVVRRAADVDAWHSHLSAAGAPILKPPKTHRDGARSFYCADPEGTTVQIIFHPPLSGA